MGRFFGRAVLRGEHRVKWLRQAVDGLELEPGVYIVRKSGAGYLGDLPDWVGWDHDRGMWAICEAKGSHGTTRWLSGQPDPVSTALNQINRMEVRDTAGLIASEGWVVASRWGTAMNGRKPVIMTVDPRNEGRILSSDEARRAENELRVDWYAGLLSAVGQEPVANRLRAGAASTGEDDRGLARVGDRVGYTAIAVDGAGLFPLASDDREDLRRTLVRFARDRNRATALVVIERECVEVARSRDADDGSNDKTAAESIPTTDGAATWADDIEDDAILQITQDGVTVAWDVDQLDFKTV